MKYATSKPQVSSATDVLTCVFQNECFFLLLFVHMGQIFSYYLFPFCCGIFIFGLVGSARGYKIRQRLLKWRFPRVKLSRIVSFLGHLSLIERTELRVSYDQVNGSRHIRHKSRVTHNLISYFQMRNGIEKIYAISSFDSIMGLLH